jgi:hypothetical protein
MTENYAPDAAKALWQSQELELPRLSPEFLHLRANDVRRIEQAEAVWGYAAFAALSAWVVWMFVTLPAVSGLTPVVWLPRLIAALLYAGAIFSAIRWHRVGGHRVFAKSASESSGLQTYCSELERLRDSRRASWNFSFYLPGYAVWIVSWWRYDTWPHGTALFVFVAGSFAATYFWTLWHSRREDERLEDEIRALQALRG